MSDMTIKAVRTTFLRVPWPNDPWLKGHAFGEARNLLVVEVETKGGIVGKRANLPLHRLWGHVKSQLPVYGSGCFRGSGGDGMIAKALYYKERGYKAIKMQMAHTTDLRRDVDNVKRMREAVGPD